MKNRQSAKERGLRQEIERERHLRFDAEIRLHAATAFVSSDEIAVTYQSLGQYREAVMRLLSPTPPRSPSDEEPHK
jgi:hypothetical protein